VTNLAILRAASLLSLPVLTKRERFSGRGTRSAIFQASRATLSGIMPEKRWMAWPALSSIASPRRDGCGRPWRNISPK
jgi:hypothetical protein